MAEPTPPDWYTGFYRPRRGRTWRPIVSHGDYGLTLLMLHQLTRDLAPGDLLVTTSDPNETPRRVAR